MKKTKTVKTGINDKTKARGQLTLCLRGPDGKIKDRETFKNLVVATGRQHIADQLAGQAQAAMSHMAIGTGTTAQAIGDTSLETELNRKAFTSKSQGAGADANKVIYVCDWPAGEGTGIISEAGIFNAASSGTMLCRTTFGAKDKGAGDSLTLTWTITITG